MGPLLTEEELGSWPAGCCGIHAVHMSGGKFLLWGYGPAGVGAYTDTWVWDSFTGQFTGPHRLLGAKVFCCGVSQLPDGRPIIAGGTDTVAGVGIKKTYIFDPATNIWTQKNDLNEKRWYPALPPLSDGTIVAVSGWEDPATLPEGWVTRVDVFNATTGSWADFEPTFDETIPIPIQPHFYPFMFAFRDPADPTAKSFFAGKKTAGDAPFVSTLSSYKLKFNGTTAAEWFPLGGNSQMEGSGAVMMINSTNPIDAGTIYKFAGVNPFGPVGTGRKINLNSTPPFWDATASMATARNQCNIVAMPNGMIAVVGGANDYHPHSFLAEAINTIQIYNPATDTWLDESPLLTDSRMYHSTASMTPNATIMTFGGEYLVQETPPPAQPVKYSNFSAQEYFPSYFQIDSIRPVVLGVVSNPTRNTIYYNTTATINVADSTQIEYLSLLKLSSTTHDLDTTQRYIRLSESSSKTSTQMFVHTPKDGGIAPPGKYMLFGVSYQGIPSVAKYVTVQ